MSHGHAAQFTLSHIDPDSAPVSRLSTHMTAFPILRLARGSWLRWLLTICLLWPGAAVQAADAGRGHVDRIELEGRQMTVIGWAVSEQPQVFLTNLVVRVDNREVYRGRMQGADRPDVAQALKRPEWRHSGLQVRFLLPRDMAPGTHHVSVAVRRGDGQEFELTIAEREQRIDVAAWPRLPWPATFAVVLAILLPLWPLAGPWRWARRPGWGRPRAFALALTASFALLVASGLTGSSLALLLAPPAVTEISESPWMGHAQAVRSDEWQVITPLAIAQATHTPRWPIINQHLGEDGQNMLVIGMTGVPVAHLSTAAKPATWGYFLFDLRRALAWAWWLPLFGALLSFWYLLRRLTGLEWRLAAALATGFALAPYAAAFSFWPAYLGMFAALGLVAAQRLLHSGGRWAGVLWGAALGWSAAAYALVLYPAWQISVATLCAPLLLAWAWRERAHWRWARPQTLGAVAAVSMSALLLGAWWLDAREAVAVMRETIYPGQRVTETGGDIDRWFLLKGWLNPLTLHVDTPMVRSEAASFQFLWLGTLAVVAWQIGRTRRVDPVAGLLAGVALFTLWFQFVGVPPWLARATLWSAVTSYRLDLALGMTQVLLLAWWIGQAKDTLPPESQRRIAALALGTATLAQTVWEVSRMPLDVADRLPAGILMLAGLASAAAMALWVLRRDIGFVALYVGWSLAAILPFHPLGQAPATISLVDSLRATDLRNDQPDADGRRGVAVVSERNWAMTLPAAGVPVINSVFYVPQPSLWQRLDPEGRQRTLHNRYQRLLLDLAPQPGAATFTIESPRLDEVRLWLDPARFDFRLLGARQVLLPAMQARQLADNPTLERVAMEDASAPYALFNVRP